MGKTKILLIIPFLMFSIFATTLILGKAVNMEYVVVGDAGNVADTEVMWTDGTTDYGSVNYDFQIGKYEVTNAQYIEFLNAVAKTDLNGLYNPNMNGPYGGIEQSGSSGDYIYSAKAGDSNWLNRPVNFVCFYDTIRFANWMHNNQPVGAQNELTTEDGAYGISLGSAVVRKASAKVWLPSEDEWYKAAYYKSGGTDAGYWNFPTQSDLKPTSELPPGTDDVKGSANIAQQQDIPMDSIYKTTEVGAYTFKPSTSAYGTFDQAGNVHEWEDSFRSFRGASFENARYNDSSSSYRFTMANPNSESYGIGFRVAGINSGCVIPTDNMIITEDTTFCTGEYELPNGIKIWSNNILLDCNGSVLIGNYSEDSIMPNTVGINPSGQNHSIMNCEIRNYSTGINLGKGNHLIKNNKLIENYKVGLQMTNSDYNHVIDNVIFNKGWYHSCGSAGCFGTIGIDLGGVPSGDYNVIEHNNISGSFFGINLDGSYNLIIHNEIYNNRYSIEFLQYAKENNITQNIFKNNWMDDDGSNNNIWQNDFFIYGVYVSSPNPSNSYCVDCIGNNYFDGATGPTCPSNCFDNDNDGVLDESDFCPETPEGEEVNSEGCSCSQIEIPFRDCPDDRCEEEFWIDYPEDGHDTCETGEITKIYSCEAISSEYSLECDPDDDNDGVLDEEDKCPNTQEEQIIYGCSCEQILDLKPGKDKSSKCSPGIIKVFTKGIGWAKDLF